MVKVLETALQKRGAGIFHHTPRCGVDLWKITNRETTGLVWFARACDGRCGAHARAYACGYRELVLPARLTAPALPLACAPCAAGTECLPACLSRAYVFGTGSARRVLRDGYAVMMSFICSCRNKTLLRRRGY